MNEPAVYISRVNTPEGEKDYVCLLPPTGGLMAEEIVGMLGERDLSGKPCISPENFSRNGVFVDLLQEVIRREAPRLPSYMEKASHVGNGPVYVIDQRVAAKQPPILPEDILGAFVAKDGKLLPESYEANPTHRILSNDGFFQLESELRSALLRELELLGKSKKK